MIDLWDVYIVLFIFRIFKVEFFKIDMLFKN